MNISAKIRMRFVWVFLLLGILAVCGSSREEAKLYYAIEANGTVYGYVETYAQDIEVAGTLLTTVTANVKSISTALGMNVDTEVITRYVVNPETGFFAKYELEADQESVEIRASAVMEGNTVRITQNMGGDTKDVPVPVDGILTEYTFFPRLLKDFYNTGLESKSYQVLDILDREFQGIRCSYRGEERIELAGNMYDTIIIDAVNRRIGSHSRYWIDIAEGNMLKTEIPELQTTYIADKSVKRRLHRFNRDAHIFSAAGVMIQDVENISYMKVSAALNPI